MYDDIIYKKNRFHVCTVQNTYPLLETHTFLLSRKKSNRSVLFNNNGILAESEKVSISIRGIFLYHKKKKKIK